MSFLGRIGKFAKTPQGTKLIRQAQDMAKDPDTKRKIDDARKRLTHKDDVERPKEKPPAAA